LILMKISKILVPPVTRCQILRLKYKKKSISAGAPPQTPLGRLQRSSRSLAVFKGHTSIGREGNGDRGRGGKGKVRVGEGKEGAIGECGSASAGYIASFKTSLPAF